MSFYSVFILALISFPLSAANGIEQQNDKQKNPPTAQSIPKAEDKNAEAKVGVTIYEQHCIICHRDGIAGAPKMQDAQDWKTRLDGRTIEDLLASAIKGLNAMPARGTCPECSEADLKAAIQYMLPQS